MRTLPWLFAVCCLPAVPEERPGAAIEEPPAPEGGGEPDPTVGRVVHMYVGDSVHDGSPILRPALVVRAWGPSCVNLQVFLDGTNDDHVGRLTGESKRSDSGVVWCTSVARGLGVGQWRWPARA